MRPRVLAVSALQQQGMRACGSEHDGGVLVRLVVQEQSRILKRFRNGELNLLVSTAGGSSPHCHWRVLHEPCCEAIASTAYVATFLQLDW